MVDTVPLLGCAVLSSLDYSTGLGSTCALLKHIFGETFIEVLGFWQEHATTIMLRWDGIWIGRRWGLF